MREAPPRKKGMYIRVHDRLSTGRDDADAHRNRFMDDKRRSFVDSIIAKKGHLIHKLKAKDTTGRWAYYFVLVEAPREAAFLKAIEGDGTIDLEDFGKVVASCYGEEPSKEVKDYLKEKYGFDV